MQPPGEPEEREPRLARRSPFAFSAKLCPSCLSPLKVTNELSGWMTPLSFYCEKCGYSGTVFVEKEPEPNTGKE